MISQNRPEPFLIADHPALDFLNSVCVLDNRELEWLADGDDYLNWLEKAGLLTSDDVNDCQTAFSDRSLDGVARKARELREDFRNLVVQYGGEPLSEDAFDELGRVNQILAGEDLHRQLEFRNEEAPERRVSNLTFQWNFQRSYRKADDLLLPLAEMIGDLVTGVDFTYLKNCEGPTCPLWFNDITKNHTRRWCTMSICGNRAKAAAFRERQRKK